MESPADPNAKTADGSNCSYSSNGSWNCFLAGSSAHSICTMSKKTSGLQRQFKECYRDSLRMITTKPMPYRQNWFAFVSHQFRSRAMQQSLASRDYDSVEYQLRRIRNQLELYAKPSVQQVHLPLPVSHSPQPLGWVAKGGKIGLNRS